MKAVIEVSRQPTHVDKEVFSADRAATEFVKEMSHDLRTPLNVIIGLCQLLERDRQATLSATQRDAVERMERNAHALLHSVNHLISCLRSGHFE